MAHSAQAKKRIRQNEKRRLASRSRKREIKTLTKRLQSYVEEKNADAAKELLPKLISKLDKAVRQRLYHKNNVARQKSHVATLVNALGS